MTYLQRLERFTDRLAHDGTTAHQQSSGTARVMGRVGALVTAPVGAVAGGAIGSFDRVIASFDTKSTGEIITHGQPGESGYRQTIHWEPSNFVQTARFLAIPPGVGLAAAGVYNVYALAVSGGGLWSLTGAALIGFVAAGIAWAAKAVIGGAWTGGKLGLRGGIGAASIAAHRAELWVKGSQPIATPRPEPTSAGG